jgi:hypothetical protein
MPSALAAFAGLVASAAGCSSASAPEGPWDGGFSGTPYVTTATTSGALAVQVRSWPDPPQQGFVYVEMTVTDADGGAPVEGLQLSVRPWMPAMNHGVSAHPVVTEEDGGGGKYLVTNLDLFMSGEWDLQTTFSGPIGGYAAPALEVQ